MRKLLAILAITGAALSGTGCDIDADLQGGGRMIVVDKIFVDPDGWQVATKEGGAFDYFYADIPLGELKKHIFEWGDYRTYWKYDDMQDGRSVPKQEPLPATIHLERYEGNVWVNYTETINCSYGIESMRITISRSDFFNRRPDKRLHFRTVITY